MTLEQEGKQIAQISPEAFVPSGHSEKHFESNK